MAGKIGPKEGRVKRSKRMIFSSATVVRGNVEQIFQQVHILPHGFVFKFRLALSVFSVTEVCSAHILVFEKRIQFHFMMVPA